MNRHKFDLDFYSEEDCLNTESYIYLVLVIYDVISNKNRVKLSKVLEGYGKRVQKSSFECLINQKKLNKLMEETKNLINVDSDSLRIYKLSGSAELFTFGVDTKIYNEDTFIFWGDNITIYILEEFTKLKKKDNTIVVENNSNIIQSIPLEIVTGIVLIGNVSISSQLIEILLNIKKNELSFWGEKNDALLFVFYESKG